MLIVKISLELSDDYWLLTVYQKCYSNFMRLHWSKDSKCFRENCLFKKYVFLLLLFIVFPNKAVFCSQRPWELQKIKPKHHEVFDIPSLNENTFKPSSQQEISEEALTYQLSLFWKYMKQPLTALKRPQAKCKIIFKNIFHKEK